MTRNRFVEIAPWPRVEQEKACLVFAHLAVHMILRFVIQGCPTLGMLQASSTKKYMHFLWFKASLILH